MEDNFNDLSGMFPDLEAEMSGRGVRVYDKEPHELTGGQYGKWKLDNNWYAVPPDTDLVANLGSHEVEEHKDGSISVTPSILVSCGVASWHGYLTRGAFVPC